MMSLEMILEILLRLAVALGFGATVGLERSYHGRPAGFRTHALVCLASAALMLVTVYEAEWFVPVSAPMRSAIDPTRMAQGIMTGIGFLGAGVIMKDGLSVRGLTTAASIWITAGIGILVGIGFYVPAALTTGLTLGALGGFRWIERGVKTESYAQFSVRFAPDRALSEVDLVAFVTQFGFRTADVTHYYRRSEGLEYRMIVHSLDSTSVLRMSEALRQRDEITEYRISPTGD
jgi:putative Mg2+ transporter-C (MgtC) family protein